MGIWIYIYVHIYFITTFIKVYIVVISNVVISTDIFIYQPGLSQGSPGLFHPEFKWRYLIANTLHD